MTRRLRDYQLQAIADVLAQWLAGNNRVMVVLPTGCGKTDILAALAVLLAREPVQGGRGGALALAHRGELLDQIAERCTMHAPDLAVGRVQANEDVRGMPITVASSATLASAHRRARLPKPAGLIVDECHHAPSPSQRKVLEWAGSFDGVRTVGVTATPSRGDGKGLGTVWPVVAFERDIAWAVTHGPSRLDPYVTAPVGPGPADAESGWLVCPYGRVVVADHVDLGKAGKSKSGDYSEGDLGRMVVQDVAQIVEAWLEHARLDDGSYRITAAFMPTVESTEALDAAFNAAGIKAETVIGTTPPATRNEIYARLAAGTTQVLCGVMVTTEGWDCPPVSCILQGRPTKLPGIYTQIVGRGLRPCPSAGKIDCLVLDVVGSTRGQTLQTLVDLTPDARYRPLPCETCLGERGGIDDPGEVEQLCRCVCKVCERYTARARRRFIPDECCDCPSEIERDPDGGRIRLKPGEARYETVDLLLATSPFRWLTTRRYSIPFLVVGDRVGAVWPADGAHGGLYIAGHGPMTGPHEPGVRLGDPCELDEARRLVEAWAVETDPNYRAKAARARGRTQPAGERLITRARRLGLQIERGASTALVNEAIDVALVSSRLEPAEVVY